MESSVIGTEIASPTTEKTGEVTCSRWRSTRRLFDRLVENSGRALA